MSVLIQADNLRLINLGQKVDSASGAFAADTRTLFTVAGGEVLVTALYGVVSTAITVANTVKLQANPTTGDTSDWVEATDIGTTDTAVGTVIGFEPSIDDPATSGATHEWTIVKNGGPLRNKIMTIGDIEQVTTGTGPDGAILWSCFWIPLTTGATLVAG